VRVAARISSADINRVFNPVEGGGIGLRREGRLQPLSGGLSCKTLCTVTAGMGGVTGNCDEPFASDSPFRAVANAMGML